MSRKSVLSLIACLGLAACATAPYGSQVSQGMWEGESITPPTGLRTSQQSDLIGRTITDEAGSRIAVIDYMLIDPVTGAPRYAVASNEGSSDYMAIPYQALHIRPSSVWVAADQATWASLPHYTLTQLEQSYPPTVAARPSLLPPVAAIPPAAPYTSTVGNPQPLEFAHEGSVVGLPVVDSLGHPVGVVDSVAAVPATGEVRYVIVSGPALGGGNYIAAPATAAHLSDGRVVLSEAPALLPRYNSAQLSQAMGSSLAETTIPPAVLLH
jgi:hypothetical protein